MFSGDLPMVAGPAIYLDLRLGEAKDSSWWTPLSGSKPWQEYKLAGKSLKGEYNVTAVQAAAAKR
jgi:hypothetical protein